MTMLDITTRTSSAGTVLTITGTLDYETAPDLRERVRAVDLAPGALLVLDLAGLDFCDSSGINAFLTARNTATTAAASIALASVPPSVARVLGIVGLDRIFAIHPDSDTAANAHRATS
ncbi:STAS domain-containing protein [Streptomyces sp. NPDC053755]|uniref:STAS domain-containing protein n=1 Tax=Streptomyces sp. NPDC053755 TaxID=3155815 RepID=UPI0034180109